MTTNKFLRTASAPIHRSWRALNCHRASIKVFVSLSGFVHIFICGNSCMCVLVFRLPVARIPRRRRSSSFFHQSSMRRQSENFRRSSFGHHSTVLDRYTPLHSKLPPSVHKYVYRIRPTIVLGDESLSKAHYEYEFRPFFVAAVIVLNIFMFIITMFVANWDFLSFHGNPMVRTVIDSLSCMFRTCLYL